jgi:hypothetical protein
MPRSALDLRKPVFISAKRLFDSKSAPVNDDGEVWKGQKGGSEIYNLSLIFT